MRVIIGGSRGEATRWSELSGHPGPDLIVSSDQKSTLDKLRSAYDLIDSDTEVCFIGAWSYGRYIDRVIDRLRMAGWDGPVPPSPKAAAEKAEDERVFNGARRDTALLRGELEQDPPVDGIVHWSDI